MDDWQDIVDAALTVSKDGGSRLASLVLAADDRIEELEAKLAKAVKSLEVWKSAYKTRRNEPLVHAFENANITLAELEGKE